MFNKKIKIIFFIIIALSLSAILIFVLKNKDKNVVVESNRSIVIKEEYSESKTKEDEKLLKILDELKNNHPEFSAEQLESFYEISKNDNNEKIIEQCKDRSDKINCIVSVAFIKDRDALCHSHGSSESSFDDPHFFLDEKSGKECAVALLKRNAQQDFQQCLLLEGDSFYNCLRNMFNVYKEKSDCIDLSNGEIREICEEVFDYEKAYSEYNRELCDNIKNEKLKQYCFKTIIDKSQDTDGDGLTDLDEINIYKTSHIFPDTDHDGYSDGDEVKNGFNPKGEGKL